MFRLFYTILFTLCMPFIYLKLLWRGYRLEEYKARKLERFGFFNAPKLSRCIWVHAVSVGEVMAAEPIIREIQRRFPDRDIAITSMTPTSSEQIIKRFGNEVFHVYAPYDIPFMVQAFLRRVEPECLIIMETELWPNMINQAKKKELSGYYCQCALVRAFSERLSTSQTCNRLDAERTISSLMSV